MGVIDLKTAQRIVSLHESVKGLRQAIAALTASGRRVTSGRLSITTAEGQGWSDSNEKTFTLENEAARKIAFNAILDHHQSRLAACIRELHQLNAEVPE